MRPAELLGRGQWMGRRDQKPFAPCGDRDHPDAAPDEDARWKCGLTENYVDGTTVAMAEDDPRLDGRAFLQQHGDPNVHVDGDDVRRPETGERHPAFLDVLTRLGATYGTSDVRDGCPRQLSGRTPRRREASDVRPRYRTGGRERRIRGCSTSTG